MMIQDSQIILDGKAASEDGGCTGRSLSSVLRDNVQRMEGEVCIQVEENSAPGTCKKSVRGPRS